VIHNYRVPCTAISSTEFIRDPSTSAIFTKTYGNSNGLAF
jgi:hypothetical protein